MQEDVCYEVVDGGGQGIAGVREERELRDCEIKRIAGVWRRCGLAGFRTDREQPNIIAPIIILSLIIIARSRTIT